MTDDLSKHIEEAMTLAAAHLGKGRVADYIPALAKVDPAKLGFALALPDGTLDVLGTAHVDPGKEPLLRAASQIATDALSSAHPISRALHEGEPTLAAEVDGWISEHRPDVVAIERVFSQHNVRTVMGTAQAGGVVALTAARAGLPVAFHTPSEVKAAVTGSGTAGKHQVTAMVTRLLALADRPSPPDAADALALAICHCWRAPMTARLAAARQGMGR